MTTNRILITTTIVVLAVLGVVVAALVTRNSQTGGNGIITSVSSVSRVSTSTITSAVSSNSSNQSTGDASETTFTLDQLATHDSATDCFTSYKGVVYNLTSFVSQHQGGLQILAVCGKQADEFSATHPGGSFENARVQSVLATSRIGKLI